MVSGRRLAATRAKYKPLVSSRALQKNFPTSAAARVSAGEDCRQSGTFTNPKGQAFPD